MQKKVNIKIKYIIIVIFLILTIAQNVNAEFVPYDIEENQREILGNESYFDNEENKTFIKYNYVGTNVPSIQKANIIAPNIEKIKDNKYKIYSGSQFIFINNDYHYLEYATTTIDKFNELTTEKISLINWINPFSAIEVNADIIYSGAGDGYIRSAGNASWDTAHDSSSGDSVDTNNTRITATSWNLSGTNYIFRGFIPFDTSAINDSETISSASLFLTVDSSSNGDNDGDDFITVIQTTQADPNGSLVFDDYDQCGSINSPIEGIDNGDRLDITSLSTDDLVEFPLNSTGISWIDLVNPLTTDDNTKGTRLGVREGHDIIDSAIATDANNGVGFRSSDYTGTDSDPYLEISIATSTEEEQTASTTYIAIDDFLYTDDIFMFTGKTEIYTDSTTTPSEIRYNYYHIPLIGWIVIIIPLLWVSNRIIIEIVKRL